MEWTTALPDWERRILARESLIPCAPLYPDSAEHALTVFKALRIVDAHGSPTMGQACEQWVFDFVSAVFGAYDPEEGRRRISEFFLLISKKNSKSTIAAGIMLTALIINWRQSGEFLILAPTVEIAGNSFGPARDMVRADEELSDLLHVQEHIKTITHRQSNATLKVVAADSETVGGKKGIITLVDELWLFGKKSNAENMLREACGGLASRPEGCTIYLSTQSDEPPAGVFAQKLQYARGVRDGRIVDASYMPVLYEYPPEMVASKAYRDPANWYVTNPNLGVSVDEEFLEREQRKSEDAGETSLRTFEAKHFNVELGLNLRSDRWAGADYWEAMADKSLTLESLIERSDVVDIGVDGGGLDDLLAISAIGRDAVTREWLHWAHAWAHQSVMERRKSEAPRFRDFAADGDLTIVENMGDDIAQLAGYVAQVEASGKLDKVGLDPHGIGGVLDSMEAESIPTEKIIGISQGWKLTGAIKTTERKLAECGMKHGGTRMMNWCCGNAKVVPAGNATLITKQASGTAKIDPLMATFNAASLMAMNPQSPGSGIGIYGL